MSKSQNSHPVRQDSAPAVNRAHTKYKIVVRPSEIHRWGVFSEERIPKGRKVIEYTGERISRKETSRRADAALNYLFTLDNYWTLDGSVGGSGAEFINHSCNPNCFAWIFKGHILYMAARDILPGEELTIDYRFDSDVPKVRCACGAPTCRGTINLKPERRGRRTASKVGKGAKSVSAGE